MDMKWDERGLTVFRSNLGLKLPKIATIHVYIESYVHIQSYAYNSDL